MKRISQLFAVVTTVLLFNVTLFSQSTYKQFGNLCNNTVTVSSTWTKLNTTSGTHSFMKSDGNTKIEVYVNSRFMVGKINGSGGVEFQVKVDNKMPTFGNQGSILKSNSSEFLSIFAVFQNIPAGNHTVSLWAQAPPSGSATSVLADPGGWGGMIIVKETQ